MHRFLTACYLDQSNMFGVYETHHLASWGSSAQRSEWCVINSMCIQQHIFCLAVVNFLCAVQYSAVQCSAVQCSAMQCLVTVALRLCCDACVAHRSRPLASSAASPHLVRLVYPVHQREPFLQGHLWHVRGQVRVARSSNASRMFALRGCVGAR